MIAQHMSPLLQQAISDGILMDAWHKVRNNDGVPGVDGESITQFAENLLGRVLTLQKAVRDDSYRPSPLLRVWMERPGKDPRGLAIPTVTDRLLQTAVAMTIGPILDQHFENCSYAYRPAHSIQMALAQVIEHRDAGYTWVVDADIYHFFDEISHLKLLLKVKNALNDFEIIHWIARWMRAPIQERKMQSIPRKGIAQGSPLSPILANLYLDQLDHTLLDAGYRVIRYADDFIILCKERKEAERALHLSEDVLHLLQLRLQPDKTHITQFHEGFHFLGTAFLNDSVHSDTVDLRVLQEHRAKNPVPLSAPAVTAMPPSPDPITPEIPSSSTTNKVAHPDPLSRTLYVTEPGALLALRNERVIIRHEGGEKDSLPLHRLDQIVLQGNQLMSTALLRACRENHAEVFLSSYSGACEIRIDDLNGSGVDTWTAQVKMQEDKTRLLDIAKIIVNAKISNSLFVVRSANRRRGIAELEPLQARIKTFRRQISQANTLDTLRGLEGIAARDYYQALGILLAPDWKWTGRNRRPPTDPINALLSYGYGLLYQNVLGLLRRAGLNPYLGVYHQMRPGHPALASDLMEEFRAVIVDRLLLAILTDPKTHLEDFVLDPDADIPCRLGQVLRKRVIQSFENRINSQLLHPVSGEKTDYRRAILTQARHFARVARDQDPTYRPFILR